MINTTGPSIDETTILLFRAKMVASDAATTTAAVATSLTHTTTVTRTGDYRIFDRILSMESKHNILDIQLCDKPVLLDFIFSALPHPSIINIVSFNIEL